VSLGLREDMVPEGERIAEASKFLKLAALGVTTFVASGDAGSNPDSSGHARAPDSQVEYEASDPWVIAVGGTSLHIDRRNGNVISEIGWSDSGGGVSNAFPRQPWQKQYAPIASSLRLVPDVSCVADPNPGAFVILNGVESPVGGTSWSAPVWAGFAALIGESREKDGKPRLGFLAPSLYRLGPNTGFREVSSGSNGAYQAGPGWNPVAGMGVPNVSEIVRNIN
jgi:kumamolisin